jgi:hypothetical protein
MIKVKKPFVPDPNAQPKPSLQHTVHEINPEFEEKPIVDSISNTSEDYHGGSELTFSLPNTSASSMSASESSNSSSSEQPSETTTETSASAQTTPESPEQPSENSATSGQSSETQTKTIEASDQPTADATDEQQPQASEANEAHGSVEEETDEEQQEEDEDEESDEEDEEDNENQAQSYTFNTQQAFDIVTESKSSKHYQTEFYRFIEMIAEEKIKFFDPRSAEEYNIRKLMFRQFERKPLQHYRMARVREAVVLLLDNSGSMTWWAKNLQVLASLAMQRNDVEVYLAPNGIIEEMIHPKREKVVHSDVMKKLRNRKIIYVGDFDGANTPVELSWYNDAIWICPETRYRHFMQHDWVSYDESKFKGAFLRVFTLEQMFNAFRKLLSSPSLRLWHDLFDEFSRSQEDEEDMS